MKIVIVPLVIGAALVLFSGCTSKKAVNAPCNTTNVRYSVEVVNILSANCYGCHAGSAQLGGGFTLDNYFDLRTMVNNGQLIRSINHLPGASPMPKNAPKMSDCNISVITAWVSNGAPNN